jgi:hypothetical protein
MMQVKKLRDLVALLQKADQDTEIPLIGCPGYFPEITPELRVIVSVDCCPPEDRKDKLVVWVCFVDYLQEVQWGHNVNES